MRTDDLDYPLPPERIATAPAQPRDTARLLVIHRSTGVINHGRVRDLPQLGGFAAGDLLVFNQSRVVPALFTATRASSGGRVQGLYVATPDPALPRRWQVLLESRGTLHVGEQLTLADDVQLVLVERLGQGQWLADLHSPADTFTILDRLGKTPLPPYIRKQRKLHHQPEIQNDDARRYNTVYARDPGSVAAPTAGLHFTPELLDALRGMGVQLAFVTLHVGLGTFLPVRTADLDQHAMHAEWFSVSRDTIAALQQARRAGRRILPVGTTTVRALESLPSDPPPDGYQGSTNLFIHPPQVTATGGSGGSGCYPFRFTDALMTNFHLPRSTLLALVAALPDVGVARLLSWYRLAVEHEYRFYSYGDAMLLI